MEEQQMKKMQLILFVITTIVFLTCLSAIGGESLGWGMGMTPGGALDSVSKLHLCDETTGDKMRRVLPIVGLGIGVLIIVAGISSGQKRASNERKILLAKMAQLGSRHY